ncbi:MAG: FMN-binding protein [Panacagrimonas sp.]
MNIFNQRPNGSALASGAIKRRRCLVVLAPALVLGMAMVPVNLSAAETGGMEQFYHHFQTPEAFVSEAFDGASPTLKVLQLDEQKQARISTVFGRRYPQQRLRYWASGGRTAWIFDDIGKEGYVPTTAGFVVNNGVLEHVRVLTYRESRGEQVGEMSFLKQLFGAKANGDGLDRQVDNISGATYSVKMMQRMSRTAIELDALVPGDG